MTAKSPLFLAFCLFFYGCAVKEEVDPLYAEQREQERREMFVMWREWCYGQGYILYVNNAFSCSSRALERGCIPRPLEWDYRITVHNGKERLRVLSTTYSCVSRGYE
jgi:hypothetical protein